MSLVADVLRKLSQRDAGYRELAQTHPEWLDGAPLDLPPCGYQGRMLSAHERAARELPHLKMWIECLHPQQPIGDVVCPCGGCGPSCPGYGVDE